MLSRETILGLNDLPTLEVVIEQWGGSVLVRTLPARDINKLSKLAENSPNDELALAKIAILGTVDDKGNPLWTSADEQPLSKKSIHALRKLVNAIIDFNKYSDEGVDDKKKKLETVPS